MHLAKNLIEWQLPNVCFVLPGTEIEGRGALIL